MLRNLVLIAVGVFLLSISGRFSWEVEWSTLSIPITLQSIVLISINQMYPKGIGIASTFIWLLLATLGLPLLADGVGGIDWINGKSSGYLFGFFMAAIYLNRQEFERRKEYTFSKILFEQFYATVIILVFGYFVLIFYFGLLKAFQFGIQPFLLGGAIKIIFGALFVKIFFTKMFQKSSIL